MRGLSLQPRLLPRASTSAVWRRYPPLAARVLRRLAAPRPPCWQIGTVPLYARAVSPAQAAAQGVHVGRMAQVPTASSARAEAASGTAPTLLATIVDRKSVV